MINCGQIGPQPPIFTQRTYSLEPMTGFTIENNSFDSRHAEPGLYIVATPIGNLRDITVRALETLASVNLVACEDTRVTGKLLARYQIKSRLISYHEHNATRNGPKIIEALSNGESVALVSDAGTPIVSDPGKLLVSQAREAGHKIVPVPGASAVLAALVGSGIFEDQWTFVGFLPNKKEARLKYIQTLKNQSGALIFFESPNRLAASLADLSEILGANRIASVCRELTKIHEEFVTDALGNLAAEFSQRLVKGEIVIVVSQPTQRPIENTDQLLKELMVSNSVSRAAAEAAELSGLSKKVLYRRALELAEEEK